MGRYSEKDADRGRLGWAEPLYRTDDMTPSQWLKARRKAKLIGASDAAGILSVDPRHTPRSIQNAILGYADSDDVFETSVGRMIEPLGMQAVGERWRMPVLRWPWVLKHPKVPLTCNLDGLMGDGTVLEMKWSSRWMKGEWDEFARNRDIVAMQGSQIFAYYIQVQSQLAVTGMESGMLACIAGEDAALRLVAKMHGYSVDIRPEDIIAHEFKRNESVIKQIEEQVERFHYWHVEREVPAPVTKAIDLTHVRKSLRPKRAEPERRDDLIEALSKLRAIRAEKGRISEEADLEEARFLSALGHEGEFMIGEERVGALRKSNKAFYWKGLDPKKPRRGKHQQEESEDVE